MKKKNFFEQLQDEVDAIRKDLGCTEAEAYFTIHTIIGQELRRSVLLTDPLEGRYPLAIPPSPKEKSKIYRSRALATTKSLMEYLEAIRQSAERGAWPYYFTAVEFCHRMAYPVPDWVGKKFDKALHDYQYSKVVTLDEAFGAERPKHYRQAKEQEESGISFGVYIRCRQLQEEGVKIGRKKDGGLFNIVGNEFAMSAGKVSKIYYKHDKPLSEFSVGWPITTPTKRRKEVK